MNFGMQVTEPKVLEFFDHFGIQISSGELSNILIKDQEAFHAEKDAVYEAGLRSSPWQHIDDTGTRVNGQNGYCPHVAYHRQLLDAFWKHSHHGEIKAARRLLSQAREKAADLGSRAYDAVWLSWAEAHLIAAQGRWPEALAAFEATTDGFARMGMHWYLSLIHI